MTRETLRVIRHVIDKIFDKLVDRHQTEVQVFTSRLVAQAKFPEQAALAAGELAHTAVLLRAERLRQKRSLAEFLAAAGMTRSTLNRIENGKRQPSVATLDRLATALGVKLVVALVEVDGQNEEAESKPATIPEETGT